MNRGLPRVFLSTALATFSVATLSNAVLAQAVDEATLQRELKVLFERPENTPFTEAQKTGLGELLKRYEGHDLGKFGYVRALPFYFRRDASGAASSLDEFFTRHDSIEDAEYVMIAGRIYMVAMRDESKKPQVDVARLHRWAERAAALYPDLPMVARQAGMIGVELVDGASFRLALVRGMQRSQADAATKDKFLTLLYTPLAEGSPLPGSGRDVVAGNTPPSRDVVNTPLIQPPTTTGRTQGEEAPPTQTAVPEPAKGPAMRIGGEVPALPTEHLLNARPGFSLTDLRGSVVVLDFFATWCPPCRSGLENLLALGNKDREHVKLVGVTRFYGKGMDFAPDAKLPHGGKSVQGLARQDEIELNASFAKAFGIDYPVLFTSEKAMKDAFGVTAIPTTFVIGKDGLVVGRVMGNGDAELTKLRELIAQASR